MSGCRWPAYVFCLVIAVLSCSTALAGDWIRPDWTAAPPAAFPAANAFGKRLNESPILYRTVIDVPARCDRATVMLRTSGWAFLWVDGRQVFASDFNPGAVGTKRERTNRNRLHWVDLTEQLTPGRHVLIVSAPDRGFVLDGGMYAGMERLAGLASSDAWTVTPVAPGAVMDDLPLHRIDYDGQAIAGVCGLANAVVAVDEWKVREDTLAKVYYNHAVDRIRRTLGDLQWRVGLLVDDGVYIVDSRAYSWGGPARLANGAAKAAAGKQAEIAAAARELDMMGGVLVDTVAQLETRIGKLQDLTGRVERLSQWIDRVSADQLAADDAKALELVEAVTGVSTWSYEATPTQRLVKLGDRVGFPVNHLNSSRYDRLGWLPLNELSDGDLCQWGVRVGPVADGGQAKADHRWWVRSDAGNVGLAESWADPDCKVTAEWRKVQVQGATIPPEGSTPVAWYRGRLEVPVEWAGLPVRVRFELSGNDRLWVNGREVTRYGDGLRHRAYVLPADVVNYGGVNVLAMRIASETGQAALTGRLAATCPSLDVWAGQDSPAVDVLSTPLSPCVVLTPRTNTIRLRHGGKAAVALPVGRDVQPTREYSFQRDPGLSANWALLWLSPAVAQDTRRPILLVFESNPKAIRCSAGMTEIVLDRPGERLIAVRPWAKRHLNSAADRADLTKKIEFWSRAARAVPINYQSVTRVLDTGSTEGDLTVESAAKGPALEQTIIYDYLLTKDQWGTEPLKVAPLPALAAYAMDHAYAGLEIEHAKRLVSIHDGGSLVGYRGLIDADRVRYCYRIEPWARSVGVTADVKGGRDRGMALLAKLGVNSVRQVGHFGPVSDRPIDNFASAGHPGGVASDAGLRYLQALAEDAEDAGGRDGRAYEMYVESLGRYYHQTAETTSAMPAYQVGFDLIDAPAGYSQAGYQKAVAAITEQVRSVDKRRLLFVQPSQAGGSAEALATMRPTGDSLTVYGFRDSRFRLDKPSDRWPGEAGNFEDICRTWAPAMLFSIRHKAPLHCAAFGDFDGRTGTSPAQAILLNDMFRLFDQFGMNFHYLGGNRLYHVGRDGGLRLTSAAKAYRQYCQGEQYNVCYRSTGDDGTQVTSVEQE